MLKLGEKVGERLVRKTDKNDPPEDKNRSGLPNGRPYEEKVKSTGEERGWGVKSLFADQGEKRRRFVCWRKK